MRTAKDLRIRDFIYTIMERDMKTNEAVSTALSAKQHDILNPKFYTYDSIRIKCIEEEGNGSGDEPEYLIINGSIKLPWNADTASKRRLMEEYYTDELDVKKKCISLSELEKERLAEAVEHIANSMHFLEEHIKSELFR